MEFGVGPLFTASMMLQLLRIANFVNFDSSNTEHWEIWESFEKFIIMCLCCFQASIAVYSGMYGDVGPGNAMLIVVQLTFAGFLVILMDDLLTKGYGFGSATSMYIATSHAERMVWDMFSPTTINMGSGPQFEGAVVNLFHQLVTQPDKVGALRHAFYRESLTNIAEILATCMVIIITIFLTSIAIHFPLQRQSRRGEVVDTYKVKLMYAGNYPVILYYSLINNLYMMSKLMEERGVNNFVSHLVGRFGVIGDERRSRPISGLIYWCSAPETFRSFFHRPSEFLARCVIVPVLVAGFSSAWTEINGSSARDVARSLQNQGMTIKGYRAGSVLHVLRRYIPVAALLGGLLMGLVTIVAELSGSISSGSGTLMAVGIIINLWEKIVKESRNSADLISHKNSFELFGGRFMF